MQVLAGGFKMNGYRQDYSSTSTSLNSSSTPTSNGYHDVSDSTLYPNYSASSDEYQPGQKRPLSQLENDDVDELINDSNAAEEAANYRDTPGPILNGVLPSHSQRVFQEMSSSINITQSHAKENGYPGGTILKIHVVNFMCHKNLEIDLGPRINFIVGHNGSGKSAILTALSVCLGGKATNTDRGKSLKELIRRGESRANISVYIQNTGSEAYQRDLYGDVIEIVRTFSTDGSQSYKLKSNKGRIVSTKKEELINILDRFQILIDNPLAILSQDAARSFLTSSTPVSLYNFLSQGINHEAMKRTIQQISASSSKTQSGLEPLRKEFEIKKSVLDKLRKEFDERKSVRELAKNNSLLEIKIQWKIVEMKNFAVAQAKRELEKAQEKLAAKTRKLEEFDNFKTVILERIENTKAEAAQAREAFNAANKEYHDFENEINKYREDSRIVSRQIEDINKIIRQIKTNQANLESQIKQEELKMNGGFEETQRQNVVKRDQFVAQLQKLQTNIIQADENINSLESSVQEYQEKLVPLEDQKKEYMAEIRDIQNSIRQVESANENFMNVFPSQMSLIIRLIEKNIHKFQHAPIGPIGKYITLKDPKWASVLARQFRNSLNAFVVVNASDRAILQTFMKTVKYHVPVVVSRPDLYDYEHTMPDRQKYRVLLDILDISDEHVKRVMIDHHRIESIILAQTRDEAEDIMYHQAPAYASSCYCLTGSHTGAVVGGGARGSSSIMPIYGVRPPYPMRTESVGQTETLRQDLQEKQEKSISTENEIKEIKRTLDQLNTKRRDYERESERSRGERNALTREIEVIEQDLSKEIDTSRIESLRVQVSEAKERLHTQQAQLKSAYEEKERTDKDMTDASGFAIQAKQAVVQSQNAEYDVIGRLQKIEEELQMLEREKGDLKYITDLKASEAKMQEFLNKLTYEAQESLEAARRTGTDYMKVQEDMTVLTANHKNLSSRLKAAEQQYGDRSFEDVSKDVIKAADALKKAKKQFVSVNTANGNIREMLVHREKRYEQILRYTTTRICQEFQHILKQRDFEGQLDIDHERKIMTIKCAPKTKGGASAQRDTRSLSGGEKSFSQIALLLSVWSVMSCNIRGLDEFDVFMDEVNRKVSMKLMIKGISEMKNGQTIFITPNNMADINVNKNDVKIFRLSDPER